MTVTATADCDGSDDSHRDANNSEKKAVVVVGCASGLVAWFTLLCTTQRSNNGDCHKIVLTSSIARTWRSFDGAKVRVYDPL